MDFSKIKKIFYIVAIISMLLSIKSKVLGATIELDDNSVPVSFILPDFVTDNNNYIFCFLSQNGNTKFITFIFSESEMSFSSASNSRYKLNSSKYIHKSYIYTTQSHSDIQTALDNLTINDYITSDTYLNSFYLNSVISYVSNQDIKIDNNVVYTSNYNNFIYPFFDNLTEIENGYPDGVFISLGDYSEDEALYFHLLKITNTVPDGNQSTYYYDSKVFRLTKDSKYYKTYDSDTDNNYSYYYIKRSALTLDTDSSYLYVLSNSGDSITNSYGILQPDIPGGIYDVVESDTAGVITEQQSLNDKIANINNNQQEIANNSNNINNYLNENTISNDTNENIDTNLDFNNQNNDLNNFNNGFFTRLTTMLSNISNYDLKEDTVVSIPFPNSQRYLELHSNVFYNNVTGALRAIINAFWTFIFTFYLWKFINKIYIAVSSGSILDNFSSNGETITNDML